MRQNRRSDKQPAIEVSTLDRMDRKILSALGMDGRLTIAELAEKVGLSQSPCWTRLKRLEASGAIERYVAIIDHKAIGVPNVVFVEVTLDRHDERVLEEFGAALAEIPEVVEAHLVTGDYDYLVKVAVAGTAITSASCARALPDRRHPPFALNIRAPRIEASELGGPPASCRSMISVTACQLRLHSAGHRRQRCFCAHQRG